MSAFANKQYENNDFIQEQYNFHLIRKMNQTKENIDEDKFIFYDVLIYLG